MKDGRRSIVKFVFTSRWTEEVDEVVRSKSGRMMNKSTLDEAVLNAPGSWRRGDTGLALRKNFGV